VSPGHRLKAVTVLSTLVGLASPPSPSEGEAVRRAIPSLEQIYREHSKTVARWAMRLLGPRSDFEDVVHDVFLVVRRRLPDFRGDAEVTTWLYEITVRVVQAARRRARWRSWISGRGPSPSRGRQEISSSGGSSGFSRAFSPVASSWGEASPDPQALLEARERTRVMYRLLDGLREDQRTTFILFELEGLSGNQIAEITGASVATVWVRLSRARRKFLECMRRWEEETKA
jgi:RNA polymerase sigma-70 factor, ECF subfamily